MDDSVEAVISETCDCGVCSNRPIERRFLKGRCEWVKGEKSKGRPTMEPNHIALFDEIKFAVARIIFGDKDGMLEVYQNIVGRALSQLNVDGHCLHYCGDSENTGPPEEHAPKPSTIF